MNTLTECLCCGSPLRPLIDFGEMPLVNTYNVKETFPLSVNRCVSCCHLQLNEFVSPSILYRDYTYCSGTGRTALDYFSDFARTAICYVSDARTVLDIASNDGSQLDAFRELGLLTYGCDPALNLAHIASDKGHVIRTEFFEDASFGNQRYDIITAQNVVAHTPEPLRFLENCSRIMADHSRLFIATSQANMIVNGECDTIYHEHVSYFNAHSMMQLATKAGLIVLDIIMHDIHGTSYVFVLGKTGVPTVRVAQRLEWEFVVGMMGMAIYDWWVKNAHEKIKRVGDTIREYKENGYFLAGCGAAAKGISMLNMAGVKLDYLYDNTPTKIGKQTSGMNIWPFDKIKDITYEKVLFVILAWNVQREIRENILKLRDKKQDVFMETR